MRACVCVCVCVCVRVCVCVCLCVCVTRMALIATMILCSRSQDSFSSVSARKDTRVNIQLRPIFIAFGIRSISECNDMSVDITESLKFALY